MPATIRPAALADSAALAHIQVDSYRRAYAGILPKDYLDHFTYAEQEQDWRELLEAGLEDILLVAVDDQDQLLGYALGRPGPTEIPPYDSELVSLHVRQDQQGQGLGRLLISAVAWALQLRGCKSMLVWVLAKNSTARAMYERLDSRPAGEKLTHLGEDGEIQAPEVAYGWADIHALI